MIDYYFFLFVLEKQRNIALFDFEKQFILAIIINVGRGINAFWQSC